MILYKNIYLKRIIIFLLVFIIGFNSIFIQTTDASILTLAAAWGGTVIAKEVLALVVALAGVGITISTQEQAYTLYEDLKTKNPALLEQMISVQPQIWTGAYNEVIQDLQDIKTGVVTWLSGIFGTLTVGENVKNSINVVTSLPAIFHIGNHVLILGNKMYNIIVSNDETSSISAFEFYVNNERRHYTIKGDSNGLFTGIYITSISSSSLVYYQLVNEGDKINPYGYTKSVTSIPTEPISSTSDMSVNISADAPALNPEWDPENDRKYEVPPLLLPKYPEIPIKEVTTPTGGKQLVYEGTIEEYIEDITNNKTWEDLDQYIKGQAPTTTLTPTATGTLAVGGTITDGLPYPYPNTDAPTGVLEGIGSLGGILQGIVNWLSKILEAILSIPKILTDIFSIPNDLELDFSPLKLTDFKNKFPFSIPWDLYNSILLFAAEPVEPNLKIDIDTDYLKVFHIIDLSMIQTPLLFARYVMVVFFIVFLILKTRDLIKW